MHETTLVLTPIAAALTVGLAVATPGGPTAAVGVLEDSIYGSVPSGQLGRDVAVQGDRMVAGGAGFAVVYTYVDGAGWAEEASLTPSDGLPASAGFGLSVALDGDRIAVGAPYRDPLNIGAVYVFDRAGTSWSEQTILVPAGALPSRNFGTDVAIDDDTVVASMGVNGQRAFAFDYDGTSWSEQELLPPDGAGAGNYGEQVAIAGDTIVVLKTLDNAPPWGPEGSAGAGYVFERAGTSWTYRDKLRCPATGPQVVLGKAVEIFGELAFVGYVHYVSVFERSGSVWSETQELSLPAFDIGSPYDLDFDGQVLVASGGTHAIYRRGTAGWEPPTGVSPWGPDAGDISFRVSSPFGRFAVGSPTNDTGAPNGGAVRTFELVDLPIEHEEAELTASAGAELGTSIAVDGATLVAGAPFVALDRGAAYVYSRGPNGWSEEAELIASDAAADQRFGTAAAIGGGTIFVGAPRDSELADKAGAVYVFAHDGTGWNELQKLTAPDAGANDRFGRELSLSGDRLAVGAPVETNLGGFEAGSVYVFERSGSTWSFTAKLRASDGFANQGFGSALSLSGTTLAIRAPGEDSFDPNAVYVFRLAGVSWIEEARLLADGIAVATDGDLLVAGVGELVTFARSGTTWSEQGRTRPIDVLGGDFGSDLALAGDRLVVGESEKRAGGLHWSGGVHVYARDGTTWSLERTLLAAAPSTGARLGEEVALSGDVVAAGAPRWDVALNDAGAAYVFDLSEPFPSFCDASDGALAACPCANPGSPDTGCDLSQGTGGIALDVVAQTTGAQNRATLSGAGYPTASAPGVTVLRGTGIDPASPVVFGDGLRCVSVPVVRVGATLAAGGTSVQTIGHGAGAGSGSFTYQLWVRNTPAMFCTPDAFNLSNGRSITW